MDGLRLSGADSTFPKLSLGGALGATADLLIPAVDVCASTGVTTSLPRPSSMIPRRLPRGWQRRSKGAGLVSSDAFAILCESSEQLALGHPDEAVRTESVLLREFIEFTLLLGAPGLTILPGTVLEGVDDADADARRRGAQPADGARRRCGLRPAIEHIGSSSRPRRDAPAARTTPDLSLALDDSYFVYQGIDEDEIDEPLGQPPFPCPPGGPQVVQARTHQGTAQPDPQLPLAQGTMPTPRSRTSGRTDGSTSPQSTASLRRRRRVTCCSPRRARRPSTTRTSTTSVRGFRPRPRTGVEHAPAR